LNQLIRKFNPTLDDVDRPRPPEALAFDPRQMTLIEWP
jgi:hypothetical protein